VLLHIVNVDDFDLMPAAAGKVPRGHFNIEGRERDDREVVISVS
jgi:hypothetical protein